MKTEEKIEGIWSALGRDKKGDPITETDDDPKQNCPFCVSWDTEKHLLKNVWKYYMDPTFHCKVKIGTRKTDVMDNHFVIAVEIVRQFLRLNGKTKCNHDDEFLINSMIYVRNIHDCSAFMSIIFGKTNHDSEEIIKLLSDVDKVREAFGNIESQRDIYDNVNKWHLEEPKWIEQHESEKKLDEESLKIIEEVGSDFISSLKPEEHRVWKDIRLLVNFHEELNK